jgi:ABC-type transport system involved in cytochrome c biogenesis permease subunit
MTTPLGYATLALYLLALGLYVWALYNDRRWLGRMATASLVAGLVLHWLALLERSRAVHNIPYQDLYGSMSLFGWLLALTYVGVERIHRQRTVGPLILPFVILLMGLATFLSPASPPSPPPQARGSLFALHVTMSILAYSAFGLSFFLSLIYLLQNRLLRDRHLGRMFWRFPPLELLERMSRTSVSLGVGALGVGMCLGFMWAHRIQGSFWNADPKEIASLLILALYVSYLWLGRTTAWRGARASLLCVCNFVVVVFSFTIVNIFLSRYHRFF